MFLRRLWKDDSHFDLRDLHSEQSESCCRPDVGVFGI